MIKNIVWAMLLLTSLSCGGFAAEADAPKVEPIVVASTDGASDAKPPVELAPGETLTEIRPEKIAAVEKLLEINGAVSLDGKLTESIGIETLAGIVTPILKSGAKIPTKVSIKLGVSSSCDCVKFRLFRIPAAGGAPVELSYDAIRGFSADNKTVNVEFEITADSKLHQRVEAPKNLPPGKFLEWMPAKEIKADVAAVEPPVQAPTSEPKIMTWKIAGHWVDCQGVAPMKCLLIQKSEKEPPQAFYDSIKGFEFQEGFDYFLKVKETAVVNPPADASSFAYELVEIISKEPVVTKAESDLTDVWVLKEGQMDTLKNPELNPRPVLEMHVKENKFMGRAPCNQYSGELQLPPAGREVRFRNTMSTRMACENLAAESDYFKLLETVETYRREDLELVLEAGEREVLRFKKVD